MWSLRLPIVRLMEIYIKEVVKLRKWVKIKHHIPGRIRLKYKYGLLASLANFSNDEINEGLEQLPFVKDYHWNQATGSLLLEYDANVVAPQLLDAIFSQSEAEVESACRQLFLLYQSQRS